MIEIAIAVVIMLFGAGGYQALASVDFKPIRINIDRRPKIIENVYNDNPDTVLAYSHLTDDYKTLLDKYANKETAYNQLEKQNKKMLSEGVSLEKKYNALVSGVSFDQFETGSGQIFIRPTLSGNNGIQHVDIYQSSYLDRLEKKIEPKPLKCIWCRGNHGTSSCPKMWDMMASYTNAEGQPGCKWCTKNYTCSDCKWYVSGNF